MPLTRRWITDSIINIAFHDAYIIGKEFGNAANTFVKAFQCTERATFEQWSVKILNKKECRSYFNRKVTLGLFLRLAHPNLARLREIYETDAEIFLVVELLTGGEVFDRIEQKYNVYSEVDVVKYIRELLQAIQYLHENDVIHGNLKAENLLLDGTSDSAKLKVTDYYMLTLLRNEVLKNSMCRTPGYVAPEVLRGQPCSKATDMWRIGVITYQLLSGNEPFFSNRDTETFRKILRCTYDLRSYEWDAISLRAKDFISRLLISEPGKRFSASVALDHPWINGRITKNDSLEGVQDRIKLFNTKRKLSMAIQVVSSRNYEEMRRLFENIGVFDEQPSVAALDSAHAMNNAAAQSTKADESPFGHQTTQNFVPDSTEAPPPIDSILAGEGPVGELVMETTDDPEPFGNQTPAEETNESL